MSQFAISQVNVLDLLLRESRTLRFIILNSSHETHCYVKIVAGPGQRRGLKGKKPKTLQNDNFMNKPKRKELKTEKENNAKTKHK